MNLKIKMNVDTSSPEQVEGLISFLQGLKGKETKSPSKEITLEEEKPAKEKPAKEKPEKEKPAKKEPKVGDEDQESANKKEVKDAEEVPSIKIEEVRALLSTKVKENRKEIKDKLTSLKSANVTSLPKEQYADFMEFLEGLK